MRTLKSCLSTIGCLTLLAVAAGGAWFYWPEIGDWLAGRTAPAVIETTPTEQLASRAEEKIRALAEDDAPRVTTLSQVELQSLLLYRLVVPPGVSELRATLQDSTVEVSALVDLNEVTANSDAAAQLSRMIGDTARVTALLQPQVTAPGEGELAILRLQAGAFPVPPLFIPSLIEQLGFIPARGNPRAMHVPLPQRVTEVAVRGGEVVVSQEP